MISGTSMTSFGITNSWLFGAVTCILLIGFCTYLFKVGAHRYILVSFCSVSVSIVMILLGAYLYKINIHGYIWPSFFESQLDSAFSYLDEKHCSDYKERLTNIVEDNSISLNKSIVEKTNFMFDVTNVSTEKCYRSPSEFEFEGVPEDYFDGKFFLTGFADLNSDGHDDIILYRQATYLGKNQEALLFFHENGRYVRDKRFEKLKLACRHEQVVFGDFNNDGHTDIYITCYTWYETLDRRLRVQEWQKDAPQSQNYLLINNGDGSFKEKADEYRVALRVNPKNIRVEGAQTFDINDDGWLDIYTGSRLYINHGGE